jgi:opacity protein-like surface antigen
MTKRTVAKFAAGMLLASSGVVAGLTTPAVAADDSGWNGTRVAKTADSGWNGTKVTKDKNKKDGKVRRAVKTDSDSGWNGTRVGNTSDSGWNGT